MTAASLTVEVIKQLALRMPNLEQVYFVPREEDEGSDLAMVEERMACQVQMAVATVCQQLPRWRPPPCDIICLRTLSRIGG